MSSLVISAMAWCDGFTLPLVVPLTDWLQPPLPLLSRTLNAPGVRLVESTPSGQHVICVVDTDPQLWHIMSNQLIHTFKGALAARVPVSCDNTVRFRSQKQSFVHSYHEALAVPHHGFRRPQHHRLGPQGPKADHAHLRAHRPCALHHDRAQQLRDHQRRRRQQHHRHILAEGRASKGLFTLASQFLSQFILFTVKFQ